MTGREPGVTGVPDVRGGTLATSALLARLPGTVLLDLQVVSGREVSPAVRRITLASPTLADLVHVPGQDLMFAVPGGGATFRRRYSIRRLDPAAATVDVDIVLHGDGPGAQWAATTVPGDRIEAIGPRGKVTLVPDAEWHLFVADESFHPAASAMIEALPAASTAVLVSEVEGPAPGEGPASPPGALVTTQWVHRGSAEPGTAEPLIEAVAGLALPEGRGHAYLGGELAVVAALRRVLVARGLGADQLSPKAYWRRGVANAAHGEPMPD